MIAILVILLLILLNGYFSLAEIALISVTESDLSGDQFRNNRQAQQVMKLIRDPEGFLSAVQVGITLLGLIEGIYGGNIVAQQLEGLLIRWGLSETIAHITSLVVGIGTITYLTIVFGELVPKSLALQIPLKISMAIAPSLNLFSRILYPFIRLLTVTTQHFLGLLNVKKADEKKVSAKDLRSILALAYQQGALNQQQLWLHQNVITFKDLTAQRIMKPASIVASVPENFSRDQVREFITETPYSYFPVYKDQPGTLTGMINTKKFLLSDDEHWQSQMVETCHIPANLPAKDIFTNFKDRKIDFGVVVDDAQKYIGIVSMQDIMEGVFGDIPELEDYADFFYKKSDKVWIGKSFIHLQRVRNLLNLPWLRDYESKYLSLGELLIGESASVVDQRTLVLNNVRFTVTAGSAAAPEELTITLP